MVDHLAFKEMLDYRSLPLVVVESELYCLDKLQHTDASGAPSSAKRSASVTLSAGF